MASHVLVPCCTLLLLLFVAAFLQLGCASTLADSIIPPWLDSYGTSPNVTLSLSFNGTLVKHNAKLLTVNQTTVAPSLYISGPNFQPDADYTFIIVDPDAFNPARPIIRNAAHWIVSNIPGSTLPSQDAAMMGRTVFTYLPPKKPPGVPSPFGVHRYYSLLFKQPYRNLNIPKVTTTTLALFSTRNFTQLYNLGYPVAGLLFTINLDA